VQATRICCRLADALVHLITVMLQEQHKVHNRLVSTLCSAHWERAGLKYVCLFKALSGLS
jgi:hypothetical protein